MNTEQYQIITCPPLEDMIDIGGATKILYETKINGETLVVMVPRIKYKEVFEMEVKRLKEFQGNPLFAQLRGFTERGFAVIEYYPESLRTYIKSLKQFESEKQYNIALLIARSISLLHSRGISHNDLKPSNIMMKNGNPVLRDLSSFDKIHLLSGETRPRNILVERFRAPEDYRCNSKELYPFAQDVFAFGGILYYIFVKILPWNDKHETELRGLKWKAWDTFLGGNKYLTMSNTLDTNSLDVEIFDIIDRCLRVNPKVRPTMIDIEKELNVLVHKYMQLFPTNLICPSIDHMIDIGGRIKIFYKGYINGEISVVMVPRSFSNEDKYTESFEMDVKRLKEFKGHPLFVQLRGLTERGYAVLEYYPDSLDTFIESLKQIEQLEKLRWKQYGVALLIARSISVLHSRGISHNDLDDSILMKNGVPILRDLSSVDKITFFRDDTRASHITERYCPPEFYDDNFEDISKQYPFTRDVFAFGGILYYIFTKMLPWNSIKRDVILQRLKRDACNIKLNSISSTLDMNSIKDCVEIIDIIIRCMGINPEARPSMIDIEKELYTLFHKYAKLQPDEYDNEMKNIEKMILYTQNLR